MFLPLDETWLIALVGVAGAVIGGIAGGLTPSLVTWCRRPKLLIDFQGDEYNRVDGRQTWKDGTVEDLIWIRARVQNPGRSRATNCRPFITAIYEVRADNSLYRVLKDTKNLQWAGGKVEAISIPQGVEYYVDLLRVSKRTPGWGIIHDLFGNQRKLLAYSGTYQFDLMISADNAGPSICKINVEYKQDPNTLRAWQVK
jgi:hypothetical protein